MNEPRIERIVPRPPPEFRMTFSRDDGWTLVAALQYYAEKHPNAAHSQDWKKWAAALDQELRAVSR